MKIIINKINESEVFKMACLRKKRTGLPVNIYVDDSGQWKKSHHANRIKLQSNKGDHPNTRNMLPMSIGDDSDILIKGYESELSQADINKVKHFVRRNKDLLNRLGEDIDIDDFIANMVLD